MNMTLLILAVYCMILGEGAVILHDDAIIDSEALDWEVVHVSDSGAVLDVEVAAIKAGERVYLHYVKNIVTDEEADRIIDSCDRRTGWSRSPIRQEAAATIEGGSSVDVEKKRTSSSCPLLWPVMYRALEADPNAFGEKGLAMAEELGLASAVSRRVARLMNVEEELIEPLQLVKYRHGEYYKLHHDHGGYYGFSSEARPYTVLIFLSSVPENDGGGHTVFPTLKLKVLPKKGDAILWANVATGDSADLLPDAVHEAARIGKAETVKYVCNVWLSEGTTQIKNDMMGHRVTKS